MVHENITLENITVVRGTFLECFNKLVPETILHADEIQKERFADEEFRKLGFWTADSYLYVVEGNEPVLYLARRDNNLIFQNIDDATKQILETGDYKINYDAAQKVINAETTVKILLSELELEKYNGAWSYFTLHPSKYEDLNLMEGKLAERIYGSGEQFEKAMEILAAAPLEKTRIYTLSPSYVRKEARDNAIIRIGWLNKFYYDSLFDSKLRDIEFNNGALCGVRRENVVEQK